MSAKKTTKEQLTALDIPSMDFDLAFRRALQTRTPVYFEGLPGVGKTARTRFLCEKWGFRLITVLLSLRDYQDIMGWPFKSKDTVTIGADREVHMVNLAPPAFAVEAITDPRKVVIFFDELSNTTRTQQALGLRLIHERIVSDYLHLDPDKVAMVAAGNPPDVAADGSEFSPPMANRFRFCYRVRPDLDDWVSNFPSYWGAPPESIALGFGDAAELALPAEAWSHARSIVAGYVKTKGAETLHNFPAEHTARAGPWPSPRSIEFASRELAAVMHDGLTGLEARAGMAQCVGVAWTDEFMHWFREHDLPTPDEILADPNGINLDRFSRGDQLYIMASGATSAVVSRTTPVRYKAALRFCRRLADRGAVDVATPGVTALARLSKGDARGQCPIPDEIKDDLLPFVPMLEKANLLPRGRASRPSEARPIQGAPRTGKKAS